MPVIASQQQQRGLRAQTRVNRSEKSAVCSMSNRSRSGRVSVPVPAVQKPKLAQVARFTSHVARAAEVKAEAAATAATEGEILEISLPKPLGLRFAKGNDGRIYVSENNPQLGNTDSRVSSGDLLLAVSASFGDEVWPAESYGQTMYAIRTRNGEVYLKIQTRGGDTSVFDDDDNLTDAEKRFRAERAGGNVGSGTREVQTRNYIMRKELERKRREMFDDALSKFRSGKPDEALVGFNEVLGLEPRKYIGDNFSRVTEIYRVTQYNIACCYSTIGNLPAAAEALDEAFAAGFENFDLVRRDKSLANLRADTKRFQKVIDKYDEPWINQEAVDFVKNIFSFGKKNE